MFLLISTDVTGQRTGCVNGPSVSLSTGSGVTCRLTAVTVSGNTFGGSATSVKITKNGSGSVVPASASVSPFTFTYYPAQNDFGKTVTITLTTDNPAGKPCQPAKATYRLAVYTDLTAPVVDSITQPECTTSTGSVALSGLPSTTEWTLTQYPGPVTINGTGSNIIVSDLAPGTYNFMVTVAGGCSSAESSAVVINPVPPMPSAPVVGPITDPSCTLSTGSVILSGLPSTGTWTLIRSPGIITTKGAGLLTEVKDLPPGTYNFAVENVNGCLSDWSANVVIPAQPPLPAAPVIDSITQPTPEIPTGSVALTGLPASGAWVITRLPDGSTITGTGPGTTITGLAPGVFTFTVTNSSGCVSGSSSGVIIKSVPQLLIINDPAPVCSPSTVDLTAPDITNGSSDGLTFTYWTDPEAKIPYGSPAAATSGTYYIKGSTLSGYSDIKPVVVKVVAKPIANAGPDQYLNNKFSSTLAAVAGGGNESGSWSVVSGQGNVEDPQNPGSAISDLASGENILQWRVTYNVCPSDSDLVSIFVDDIKIPTLITPNGDQMNEYFELRGIESHGKAELTVFDRNGTLVYKNSDYDNKWNGVDYNKKPLPDDTYFYIINTAIGKSYRGYIVIKR